MTSSSDSAPVAAPDCPSSPHLPEERLPPGVDVASLAPRMSSLRSISEPQNLTTMTASSTPIGALNAARRPVPAQQPSSSIRTGGLTQDMQAKMQAFHLSRQGAPPRSPLHASESDLPHSISTSNIQAYSGQPAAGVAGVL